MSGKTFVKMTVQSPFTTVYPRYNRYHAVQALKQLGDEFLVLDCESNGVGKTAELTELAILDFKTGNVLFNSLLHPRDLDGRYEVSKSRQVSGIGILELWAAPTLPEKWDEILPILQSKHITSFNTTFDLPLIRNSANKWDLECPPLAATCLMKIATAYLNLDFWVSLQEAAGYFAIDDNIQHRALGDAMTTREMVRKMKPD